MGSGRGGPLEGMEKKQTHAYTHNYQAPLELVQEVARTGRLPVVNFAAGGVATPADAALMMQLGMDGVFVGSGIFKSTDPVKRARAIVQAVTHFKNPKVSDWLGLPVGVAWRGLCRRSIDAPPDRSHNIRRSRPTTCHVHTTSNAHNSCWRR